jgi:hypothetical protein
VFLTFSTFLIYINSKQLLGLVQRFSYLTSFNLHSHTMKYVLLPIIQMRKQVLERLSNLSNLTQLIKEVVVCHSTHNGNVERIN